MENTVNNQVTIFAVRKEAVNRRVITHAFKMLGYGFSKEW
jgi:hypothetical protein